MPINLSIEYHRLESEVMNLRYQNSEMAKALREFLRVINRSDAALFHYDGAIKMAESALQKVT